MNPDDDAESGFDFLPCRKNGLIGKRIILGVMEIRKANFYYHFEILTLSAIKEIGHTPQEKKVIEQIINSPNKTVNYIFYHKT